MLVVGSLGPRPGTATLETLLEFERCDRVFDAARASEAWAALKRGERVGLRVSGVPPAALLERCAKAGVAVRLLPALSRADLWLAETGKVLGHDLVALSSGARGVDAVALVEPSGPGTPSRELKGASVLLTGATGFIGSRLAARLAAAGARLHALVRAPEKAAALRKLGASLLKGDIEDAASVRRAVTAARPDFVFSLAAVRDGDDDPRRDAKAAVHLGEALAGKRLTRWVRTGLRAGPGFGLEADEALHDLLLKRFRLPLVSLRLFRVVEAARHTTGGRARFAGADLVHVDDVVEAYRLAALRPAAVGRAFDIGRGRAGKGAPGHAADPAPARKLIGWRPKITLAVILAAFAFSFAPSASFAVDVRPDARVDLMALLQRLSGDDSLGAVAPGGPLEAALKRFAPYKDHAAVKRLASLRAHGFTGAIPTQYALYLDGPVAAPRLFNPKDAQEELAAFRRELDAFRKDTGFEAWWKASRGVKDGSLVKAVETARDGRDLDAQPERYLGVRSWDRLIIVPSAFVPPAGPSEWVLEEKAGLPDIYIITGPRSWAPAPEFGTSDDLAATAWYEIVYSLAYVLADRCPGLAPPEGTCPDMTGRGCLQRLWVDPVVRRLVALEFGYTGIAPKNEGNVVKPWDDMRAALADYEKDRTTYPTFFEFLPRLAEAANPSPRLRGEAGRGECRLVDFSLLNDDYARRLRFYLDYKLAKAPDASAYKDRAQARAFLGDAAGALEDAEAAARLAPKDPEAWNDVGVLLQRVGRLPEARAALEKAATLGGSPELQASIRSSLSSLLNSK